jgi:hypothetical protein
VPFVLILIAGVLIVSAYQNTHGTVIGGLEQDVPAFGKWALGIGGTAALGFIPGMEKISRWLTALVVTVIVVRNWQQVQNGITDLSNVSALPSSGTATADPATQYATSGPGAVQTAAVTGGGSTSSQPAGPASALAAAGAGGFSNFNPASFLAQFEGGFGGPGGFV